jgi:hypothetical protein
MVAQADLEKNKTKEASDALNAVADGVLFFDATIVNPMDVAARRIWMSTQDYAGKNYKAATIRLAKAKTALQDVAQSDNKALQVGAKNLISKIDAIDVTKAGDKTGVALEALWRDTRMLVDQPLINSKNDVGRSLRR